MRDMTLGYAALRKGRRSMAAHAYLVTFATCRRRPHFASQAVAFDACRWLAAGTAWRDAKLLAWILMPDHWHGILQLGDMADLSGSVGAAKGRVARALGAKHPQIGTVWQDGFHDQAIRGESHLRQAARYIVMNPVRAGIVKRIADYPYWDAVWLSEPDPEITPGSRRSGLKPLPQEPGPGIGAESPPTEAMVLASGLNPLTQEPWSWHRG